MSDPIDREAALALVIDPQAREDIRALPAVTPAPTLAEALQVPEIKALVEAARALRVRYDVMGCGDGPEAVAVDRALRRIAEGGA